MKSAKEMAEEALTLLQPIDDPIEASFARCEGLLAHGFAEEAWRLAVRLTRHLFDHPPDLIAAAAAGTTPSNVATDDDNTTTTLAPLVDDPLANAGTVTSLSLNDKACCKF